MAKDESGALARFGVTDRDIEQALGRGQGVQRRLRRPLFRILSVRVGLPWKRDRQTGDEEHWPGVGVRATAGEKPALPYSDELTSKDLNIAADTARYIANSAQGPLRSLSPIDRPPTVISIPMIAQMLKWRPDRVTLLNAIDAEARR